MDATRWDMSRLFAGLACVIVAVGLLVLGESDSTTAGAVTFAVLGLAGIIAARKKS